jgi:hypothetical protein
VVTPRHEAAQNRQRAIANTPSAHGASSGSNSSSTAPPTLHDLQSAPSSIALELTPRA